MKRLAMLVLGFLFVLAMATVGFCWDLTEVDGEGQIQAWRAHGNDNVGGVEFLDAGAKFWALDFRRASGSLDLDGSLLGNSLEGPNFGLSWNLASISSGAQARGLLTNVETRGLIGQENWVIVGSPTNYVAGQNFTLAEYEIERSGWGPRSVEGGALVGGITLGFVNDSPTKKEAFITTKGGSLSWVRGSGCGDPIALGDGSIQLQSYLVKPGIAAVANGSGKAVYFASGPRFAAGSLNITGHTNINLVPNGVHLSSHVSARSKAVSR